MSRPSKKMTHTFQKWQADILDKEREKYEHLEKVINSSCFRLYPEATRKQCRAKLEKKKAKYFELFHEFVEVNRQAARGQARRGKHRRVRFSTSPPAEASGGAGPGPKEPNVDTEAQDPIQEDSEGPTVETEAQENPKGPAVDTEAQENSKGPAVETEAQENSKGPAVDTEAQENSKEPTVETEAQDGIQNPKKPEQEENLYDVSDEE